MNREVLGIIEQIHRVQRELGHARMNVTLKMGNVPDEFVTRSMGYMRDVVFPAVRHLGEEIDPAPAQAAE